MLRVLFLVLALFAMPVSLARAEGDAAAACGAPYPVIELLTYVNESTDFSGPLSDIANGRLGLALEKIEMRDSLSSVAVKLGPDATEAVIGLMFLARGLIRGEIPPEKSDVINLTADLKAAINAPCFAFENPEIVEEDGEASDDHAEADAHEEHDTAEHDVHEADTHAADAKHDAKDSHETSMDDHSDAANSDHSEDDLHAMDKAHDDPAEGHEAHDEHDKGHSIWLDISGFVVVGIFAVFGLSKIVTFRFGRRRCKIPTKLTVNETEVYGYVTRLSRKKIEFDSDIIATVMAFSYVNSELPHAVTIEMSDLELTGMITSISSGDAEIKFDKPLKLKQFQTVADESIGKRGGFSFQMPIVKNANA